MQLRILCTRVDEAFATELVEALSQEGLEASVLVPEQAGDEAV